MKTILFLTILIFQVNNNFLQAQNDTLIYIGDPMCSWCYGFSPELDKVKEAFPDTPFEIVMGGLRPGGTETMGDLKNFLHEHWIEVQKASGQKFNFSILNQSDVIYDTEPACRAVIVAGKLKPGIQYAFFKEVQHAFYVVNAYPNDVDTYVQIAIKLGIDGKSFHKLFESKQSKADVYSDFDLAGSMGIRSFPALIAKIDGKLYMASSGYQKADRIIAQLKGKGME